MIESSASVFVLIMIVLITVFYFSSDMFINIKKLPSYQIVKKGNLYHVEQLIIITKFWLFVRNDYIFICCYQYENEALDYVMKQEQDYAQGQEETLIYKSK